MEAGAAAAAALESTQPMLFDLEVPPPAALPPLPLLPPLTLRSLRRPGAAALKRAADQEEAQRADAAAGAADTAAAAGIVVTPFVALAVAARSEAFGEGGAFLSPLPGSAVHQAGFTAAAAAAEAGKVFGGAAAAAAKASQSGGGAAAEEQLEHGQRLGVSSRQAPTQRCSKPRSQLLCHSRSALWVAALICLAAWKWEPLNP